MSRRKDAFLYVFKLSFVRISESELEYCYLYLIISFVEKSNKIEW